MLTGKTLVAVVFVQGEALTTSPTQKFQEVQAGIKYLVVLKHHLVKCINWQVTVGVSIFECGHGGVKCVCLMAERWILHGNYLESMLKRKKES